MQAVEEEGGRREGTGRRRRVGLKKLPMKRVFAGAYLDQDPPRRPRHELANNYDVSRYILSQSLLDLGSPITGPSPDGDEKIAKMMAAEVVAAIARPGASSVHWYSEAIERAVAIASIMHPEIADDEAARAVPGDRFKSALEARTVFFAATAITSQNVKVPDNIRYALEQYRSFVETGRFAPKGYGNKAHSMKGNLARFNQMMEVFDNDIAALGEFLNSEFSMKDLRDAAGKFGLSLSTKELADETVNGSMLFGPKIGQGFFQNLMGNFENLTVDLWFMRTWGRLTGTLIKGEATQEQLNRLANSLSDLDEEHIDRVRSEGIYFEPAKIPEMDPIEVLDLCRSLGRIWERWRKVRATAGEGNQSLSEVKAALEWPGAAEAVAQALGETVDQPTSGSQRRWIRSVVDRSLEILASNDIVMSPAQLQATLWYPERNIYNSLANRNTSEINKGYDDALYETARWEGYSHELIEDRLLAMGADGFVGRWNPETVGPSEPGAVQGDGPGTPEGGGRPEGTGSEILEEVVPSEAALRPVEREQVADESDEAEAGPVEEPSTPSFSP